MLEFHQFFAWVVVATNAAVGLWATAAHYWPKYRSRAMWWGVLIAETTIAIQILAGVALIALEHRETRDFHAFYGFSTGIAAVILYSYRSQLKHVKYLLYGLGSLFLMGMALRAIQLG